MNKNKDSNNFFLGGGGITDFFGGGGSLTGLQETLNSVPQHMLDTAE